MSHQECTKNTGGFPIHLLNFEFCPANFPFVTPSLTTFWVFIGIQLTFSKILMKIWLISTCSGLHLPFSINWLSIAVAFCPTNFSWKASPITKNTITPHGTVLRWPVHYSLHMIGTVYIPHIFWFNYNLMLVSFYFCLVSVPTENSPSGINGNRYIHQFLLPLAINKKNIYQHDIQ